MPTFHNTWPSSHCASVCFTGCLFSTISIFVQCLRLTPPDDHSLLAHFANRSSVSAIVSGHVWASSYEAARRLFHLLCSTVAPRNDHHKLRGNILCEQRPWARCNVKQEPSHQSLHVRNVCLCASFHAPSAVATITGSSLLLQREWCNIVGIPARLDYGRFFSFYFL